MKVAVTGARGFIGRHVLAELAKHPVDVVAITRQPSIEISTSPQARIIQLDLRDEYADSLNMIGNPDVFIHLAWGGLPNYKSLHHFEEELPTHYRFLRDLIKSGLKNILVTGTCFEYGMQSGQLNERMATCPNNPYGFAKDALRTQLGYLKTVNPFSLIWGRLFYLHGDGQAENSLLPQLRRAVEHGDKILRVFTFR
jgi:dTDP-6-deoxy-L-talose 4-dehydrogenase (NAD+)